MSTWKDVRNHIENAEPLPIVPDGTKLYPVVGLSFVPGYPENILSLAKIHRAQEVVLVNLVRNPQNQYDKNAIEVHVLNNMVGHLSKDVAAELAPLMDAGQKYIASVFQVRISPDNPNNPGLDIVVGEWPYA